MDILAKPEVLIDNIEKVIVGKRDVIRLLVVGLLAKGHVLIEDVPGVGKTMMSRALAQSIEADFKRIQFTPDLLPSDITGVSVFNQKVSEFEFRPGPIFANIILADEVNRTTPRTQSGLLECMQEHRVTVEGVVHKLPELFFVIATQNPIEFRGTYPLPESQLDRFLMKLQMGYPGKLQENEILARHMKGWPIDRINPVLKISDIVSLQERVQEVYIGEDMNSFIINIVEATRNHPDVKLGVSPRGSIALMQASRAFATIEKRDYVTPEDIKSLAVYVLAHRLILEPHSQVRGITAPGVISDILNSMTVPIK